MDAQSRFVPNELLRILDIDDLRRVRNGYRVEREMTVLISDIRGYTTMLEDMNVGRGEQLGDGLSAGCRAPDHRLQRHDPRHTRGRDRRCLRIGTRRRPGWIGELRPCARTTWSAKRSALRNCGRESASIPAMVGVGLVGGVNRMVLTIIGDAVNLAAASRHQQALRLRFADLRSTYARLPERAHFDIRRMERVMVVNRRRPVTIYEVYDEDSAPVRAAKRSAQSAFDEAFALFDAGDSSRHAPPSNDAASCCPTTPSRLCISRTATQSLAAKCPPAKK